jgi:hypothetical protein
LLFGDKLKYIKGVELLTDLYEASVTAINSYEKLINSDEYGEMFSIRCKCPLVVSDGDFLLDPFASEWIYADIVFANSTCFNSDLMQQIADKAFQMRAGSRFITFTSPLPSEAFEIKEKINLGMSWGTATCYIHIRYIRSYFYAAKCIKQ